MIGFRRLSVLAAVLGVAAAIAPAGLAKDGDVLVRGSCTESSTSKLKLSREKCLEQIDLLEQQKNDLQEALAELRRIYASLSTKLVEANAEQG